MNLFKHHPFFDFLHENENHHAREAREEIEHTDEINAEYCREIEKEKHHENQTSNES